MNQANSVKMFKVLSGGLIGFSLFWLTSHPKSKLKSKISEKRYKNLAILPNVRYHKKDKVYHFHHWLVLSIFYLPLLMSRKFRKSHTFHGLFLGSILQGLLYKDSFRFSYPKKLIY